MAEKAILEFLKEEDEIPDSQLFAASVGIDHTDLENVIKSLRGFEIIESQDIKKESFALTDEGKSYAADGSPEVQFYLAVPPEGITRDDLKLFQSRVQKKP
ncbi:putative Phenylalanine--tRNA ligase alpha subunit, cytoplasmic [Cocos nucifera]|nr:putative Phenylalanine--tRNA ligase alpha subunit, cytoplasmic [Cocos nucifera]